MSDYIKITETVMTAGADGDIVGFDRYSISLGGSLDPNIPSVNHIYSEYDGSATALHIECTDEEATHIKINGTIYVIGYGSSYTIGESHYFQDGETYNIELLRPRFETVPDTNDFGLDRVVEVINPSTTNSLIDCFNEAEETLFDEEYVGNQDRLYNFRNYGYETTRNITINVKDQDTNSNIQGASVDVSGYGSKDTNSSGDVTFELPDGSYDYVVSKSGYYTDDGSITVDSGTETFNITIEAIPEYNLSFKVVDDGNVKLEGVHVNIIGGTSGTTDSNGEVTFTLYEGGYSYSASKTGYKTSSGSTRLDSNKTINITLYDGDDHTCNVDIILHADEGGTYELPEEEYYIEGWMYAYDEAGIITRVISIDRSSTSGNFYNNTISNIPSNYKAVIGYLQVYRMVDGNKQLYEKVFIVIIHLYNLVLVISIVMRPSHVIMY